MKKLTEKEGEVLYQFLHKLKRNKWMLDSDNLMDLSEIYEWHFKLHGDKSYDDKWNKEDGGELQLCYMVKDLCDYFKKEILEENKKRCSKCRKVKDITDFFEFKLCKECRKKANGYVRKYNKKTPTKKS